MPRRGAVHLKRQGISFPYGNIFLLLKSNFRKFSFLLLSDIEVQNCLKVYKIFTYLCFVFLTAIHDTDTH